MKHRRPPPLNIGLEDVENVLTITEAAALAKVNRRTIMYHIDAGHLTARQTGKMWLISRKSLVVLYRLPYANIDVQKQTDRS